MKIKSRLDVITNSSSEVFIIRPKNQTKEEVLETLTKIHKENLWKGDYQAYRDLPHETQLQYDMGGSGMGGILEVTDFHDRYEEHKKSIPKSKRSQFTEEMYALLEAEPIEDQRTYLNLDIDNAFNKTLEYVINNYDVIEADGGYFEWSEDGEKIVGRADWKTWKDLTDLQKYGKHYVETFMNEFDEDDI